MINKEDLIVGTYKKCNVCTVRVHSKEYEGILYYQIFDNDLLIRETTDARHAINFAFRRLKLGRNGK